MTEEEKKEANRLLRIYKQYEGLIRISRNLEQVSRAKRDLKKVKDKLEIFFPNGIPEKLEEISKTSEVNKIENFLTLQTFPIQRIADYCNDEDVNLLANVLTNLEEEFFPSMTEKRIQLEFSLAAERETYYARLDGVKHHLKNLLHASYDHSVKSRNDEMRAEIQNLKLRYTRIFLSEGVNMIKSLLCFWKKIESDAKMKGNSIRNFTENIYFDSFEKKTYFTGKSVQEVIETLIAYLSEALEFLNIPEVSN